MSGYITGYQKSNSSKSKPLCRLSAGVHYSGAIWRVVMNNSLCHRLPSLYLYVTHSVKTTSATKPEVHDVLHWTVIR